MASETRSFIVRRFSGDPDTKPRWQRFEVQVSRGMTILEGLQSIRDEQDATLSWRSSCRMGVCGSCAMLVNGEPCLACNTQLQDLRGTEFRIAPLANFRVIKDLVPDLDPMFRKHATLKPWLIRRDVDEQNSPSGEYAQSPEELTEYLQFSYCIKRGACVAACPTGATDPEFAGPMPLAAAYRYSADSRDQGVRERHDAMNGLHAAPHCHYAGECTRVCPKGVDPARAIQLLKRTLVRDSLGLDRGRRPAPLLKILDAASPPDAPAAPPFTVDTDRRDPD